MPTADISLEGGLHGLVGLALLTGDSHFFIEIKGFELFAPVCMVRKVKNDPVENKIHRNRKIKAPFIVDGGPFFSGENDISADQINIGKRRATTS